MRNGGPGSSGVRSICVALVALVALMLLAIACSAMAWQHPTAAERVAIKRVAKQAPHAGNERVHVSMIRVSSVGPWASAQVTIYFGHAPDNAVDILHQIHGKWTNASVGTAGEWCVMPPKDRRNLGFSSAYKCS